VYVRHMRNAYTVFLESMKEKDNLEDMGIDERII
jgi:hypothetical protein